VAGCGWRDPTESMISLAPLAWLAKAGIPCFSGADDVGLIPANSDADAQNVPCFRRWRFKMILRPGAERTAARLMPEGSIAPPAAVQRCSVRS
jgi:hypothetical protein